MPNRIPLWENDEKKIPEGVHTRDLDREDLIKRCIAYGIAPVRIEMEILEHTNKETIWVHFLPEEIDPLEQKYFGQNKEILTSIRMQAYADTWWRDMLVAAKSKRRYLDREKKTTPANGN